MSRNIGSVRTKRGDDPNSMKDKVLNEEQSKRKAASGPGKRKTHRVATKENTEENGPMGIDYAESIDNIINSIYDKELGANSVIRAMQQMFESRGKNIPFEARRFNDIVKYAAEIQAAREIAWLFGLGAEHADHIAKLMIEKYFGFHPSTRKR